MKYKVEIEKYAVNNYIVVARDEYGNVVAVERDINARWKAVEIKKRWQEHIMKGDFK